MIERFCRKGEEQILLQAAGATECFFPMAFLSIGGFPWRFSDVTKIEFTM